MGSEFEAILMTLLLLLMMSVVTFIPQALGCYSSIISFGDSVSDTGNLYNSSPNKSFNFFFPPYGETYFHHPTGRCSDGRLVIDFIAESMGLPLVQPYLESHNQTAGNIEGGVNFAVVGATALDTAFLEEMAIYNEITNDSLRIQLDWFQEMLSLLCNTSSERKLREEKTKMEEAWVCFGDEWEKHVNFPKKGNLLKAREIGCMMRGREEREADRRDHEADMEDIEAEYGDQNRQPVAKQLKILSF